MGGWFERLECTSVIPAQACLLRRLFDLLDSGLRRNDKHDDSFRTYLK
jgi:hypothetical protein